MDQCPFKFGTEWTKHNDSAFSNYQKTTLIPLDKFIELSKDFPQIEFKLSFFNENLKSPSAGQYKIKNGEKEILKYWSPEWHNEKGKRFFDVMTKLYFPHFRAIAGN